MAHDNSTTPTKFWDTKLGTLTLGALGWVIVLAVWQVLSLARVTILPGPDSLFTDAVTREFLLYPFYDKGGVEKGLFWSTIGTLKHALISYFGALVLGLCLGLLFGINVILNKMFSPLIQFLQSFPPLIFLPFIMALLVKDRTGLLILIAIITALPILTHTTLAIRQIPQDYLKIQQILNRANFAAFRAMLPLVLPSIFTGLRAGLLLAWFATSTLGVFASLGAGGIDWFLWEAFQDNHMSNIILAMIYIGVVGSLLGYGIDWLQHRVLPRS
jgi:bicarbonate transport system permease protein